MQKKDKAELINHFSDIDRGVSYLYYKLISDEELSILKLDIYIEQLERLVAEFKETRRQLEEAQIAEIKKAKLKIIISVLLSIIGFIITIFNSSIGIIILLSSITMNIYNLDCLFDDDKKEVKLDESKIHKLINTIKNCQMLLTKRINKYKQELQQGINIENYNQIYVNKVLMFCLEGMIPVPTDKKVVDLMIDILQKDLKTEENNITQLIEMARKISVEEPFSIENDENILTLTRKKKKNK